MTYLKVIMSQLHEQPGTRSSRDVILSRTVVSASTKYLMRSHYVKSA